MRWHIPYLVICLLSTPAAAGELPDFSKIKIEGLVHTAAGVTRRGTPIDAFVSTEDGDFSTKKFRILLVGGLDGERESVDAVLRALQWFHIDEKATEYRKTILVSAIPCANPDGVLQGNREKTGSGANVDTGYPPEGKYYQSEDNVEAQYLWRWIGMHAPDLVVDVRKGDRLLWQVPYGIKDKWVSEFTFRGDFRPVGDSDAEQHSLVTALNHVGVDVSGRIAALRVSLGDTSVTQALERLLAKQTSGFFGQSEANRLLRKRQDVSLLTVGRLLPHAVKKKPGGQGYVETLHVAALARLILSKLGDHLRETLPEGRPDELAMVMKLHPVKSGSDMAGRLMYVELARHAAPDKRESYLMYAREAADLAFDQHGEPLPHPPFHNEMSDAVFMSGPLLAGVGALTDDKRYFDACTSQTAFIRKLLLRKDGLYQHSPLCDAAWGRGNGFAAMGTAMMLADLPASHPRYEELREAFLAHLEALLQHQESGGMWHQVIDHPESYQEFTASCQIAFALSFARQRKWLGDRSELSFVRAANAIQRHITEDGKLINVCTSTGKQKTLRDYFDREAIFAADSRGQAMALMFFSQWYAQKPRGE